MTSLLRFLALHVALAGLAATTLAAEMTPREAPEPVELKFSEFYEMPIGSRGLVMTQGLRALDGRRVRIVGYMARQETPAAGFFILSPVRVSLAELADGPADDLPPAHVFVLLPDQHDRALPYPDLLALTGTLQVGRVEQADGRVSWVRLQLEPR